MFKKSFMLCAALLLVAAQAQAVTIASWDLSGTPGDQATQPAASSAANVTGTAMTRTGVGPNPGANSFNSIDWSGTGAGKYLEFGFDVAPGYQVALTDLTIATRSSGTGPGTLGLYSSFDGYASPLATFVQPNTAFVNSIVNLTSLTGLTGSFRVRLIEIGNTQADGSGDTAATGTFRIAEYQTGPGTFADVAFTGTVTAVPEPSTVALAIAGGLGMLLVARRRLA